MKEKSFLFNRIANIYGLFFNKQKKAYNNIIENIKNDFDFSAYESVIDIGCGTGALCVALSKCNLKVTGVDPAVEMLSIAAKKTHEKKYNLQDIEYIHGNVLEGLPFENKSFDLAISSYVAHGFNENERLTLYNEMRRIAKYAIVIFDYNEKRSIIVDIIEWLEGGDYFNFIKSVKEELITQFGDVAVVNIGKYTDAYICKLQL